LKNFDEYQKKLKYNEGSMLDRDAVNKYFKKKNIIHKKKKVYFKDFHKNELYKDIMFYSLQGSLPHADTISMNYGIENRSPILSHKLFELSFSLPGKFLFRNGYGKAIFRECLSGVIDTEIKNTRIKTGFFTGLEKFFNFEKKIF
jgi:asparagine synthase (glutamine-hydrolysing)